MKTVVTSEIIQQSRAVEQLVVGQATSDGAGVKLTRVLTQPYQYRLDPFLMLDAFGSDNPDEYIAGFPDHPHRGFETITYMLEGRMRHRDSAGNEGLLENGGVQWMTAGRGVIHSELPEQEHGRMEGFQLWLNLAAKDKMTPAWYRDFKAADIPEIETSAGVVARVIAGQSHGVAGAMYRVTTEPIYLDVHMPAESSFTQAIPADFNAFIYVYRGEVKIGQQQVPLQRMAILKKWPMADGVTITASDDARLILVAGRPLGETIAQYGPFVMNSQEEIFKAIDDFRHGRLVDTITTNLGQGI
ncbi:pirin family protein [Undibacterium sp. LX40W]|uniref:Pirin family protein n=1 Tax=Undibacterium nitidum TaxID=2762298 RepID=A0A923HQJ2_9BURK|nr:MULTISPECIES: pirin family protein [Undibacterium]MBC3883347.1 pirin family protein [Undibacterium nitidum]MBC3893629.1 pirin family protein [Undibacterium sp. LX40W]